MLIDDNPAKNIRDIETVDIVFKDGVGYDSKKIFASSGASPVASNTSR